MTPGSIAAYRAMQDRFVHLWSPGKRIEVDTPHYTEPVIPQRIADYLREVMAEAGHDPELGERARVRWDTLAPWRICNAW